MVIGVVMIVLAKLHAKEGGGEVPIAVSGGDDVGVGGCGGGGGGGCGDVMMADVAAGGGSCWWLVRLALVLIGWAVPEICDESEF